MPTDASTPPVVVTSVVLGEPAEAVVECPLPADVQVQPKHDRFVTSLSSATDRARDQRQMSAFG
jgi:hypothetical protein